MRAVNLLPRDDGRRRKVGVEQKSPVLVGSMAGFVLVTAILAAWFLTASAGVADKQKRLDAAQAELAATPVPPPTAPGSSALAQEKTARIAALSTVLSGRLAWDRIFRELSLVLPGDVWLTTLSAQAPTAGAAPGTGAAFSIDGQAYSHDGVARLLARLALVPDLTGVTLQHSTLTTTATGRKVVEFAINATVKGAGASS
jgi:Tfp pilus assembly protein PilN